MTIKYCKYILKCELDIPPLKRKSLNLIIEGRYKTQYNENKITLFNSRQVPPTNQGLEPVDEGFALSLLRRVIIG